MKDNMSTNLQNYIDFQIINLWMLKNLKKKPAQMFHGKT